MGSSVDNGLATRATRLGLTVTVMVVVVVVVMVVVVVVVMAGRFRSRLVFGLRSVFDYDQCSGFDQC